ncbi:hypothetical protein NEF87_001675 [Candidatus Lokiarchaeum ossiferum]|uniref:Metallo-beta-lactamase domain-containing protein n=1 Tax=Candidatus Lokiarchaeum ossiferum TaxID=2951803 RepID=A0ABY6HPD5_9ARCH|nr:hypothetical protein NEF87_001675 [Candidatus Lokiarchaeum sp. B-35]
MSIEKAEIIEVTDKIYLHRYTGTRFNEGNISCINMKWGLIFIDAGARMDKAAEFRKQMEQKFQKSSKILVLTHTDGDHIQGMDAFADLQVIVSESGMQKMVEDEREGAFKKEFRQNQIDKIIKGAEERKDPLPDAWMNDFAPRFIKAKFFLPNISFKNQMYIRDNTQTLTLTLIQGHTPCSILIEYRSSEDNSQKILFTGDNLNAEHADNSGCMLGRSMESLKQIKHIIDSDFNVFVPGHGPVVDKEYAIKTLAYLTEMKSRINQLIAENLSKEAIITHPSLPVFYETKVPDFLPRVISLWYDYFNSDPKSV